MTPAAFDIYPLIMHALDLISQGVAPTMSCQQAGITVGTLNKYVKLDNVIAELYQTAMASGHDHMADALLNINDISSKYGVSDPKEMRVISDNLKWYLSKRNPGTYGDRVVVENVFTADKAIVEALTRGKQRAQGQIVDVVAEDVAFDILQDLSAFGF